jgi:adenylyltransferase/sulfurtransferase
MTLSPAEAKRYARHLVLKDVGGAGQQKLKAARVLVVGELAARRFLAGQPRA